MRDGERRIGRGTTNETDMEREGKKNQTNIDVLISHVFGKLQHILHADECLFWEV